MGRAVATGVLVAVAAGAAMAGCGCGGGDGDAASTARAAPAGGEAAALAAVHEYVDAFVGGDGDSACELLTEESRREFVEAVEAAVGTSDCGEAFTAAARQFPAELREDFGEAPIEIIDIDEDSAEGRATFAGRTIGLQMRVEDGEWRVANLPGQ
jgi:hypothetical protein